MKSFLLILSAIVLISGCKKNDHDPDVYFKGHEITIGMGKAWSWIQLDQKQGPVAVGISMTDAVLDSMLSGRNQSDGFSISLTMPEHEKDLTPFQSVSLKYQPANSEERNNYDAAHFLFVFHTIPAVPPGDNGHQVSYNSDVQTLTEYIPATYTLDYNNDGMQAHWLDNQSPELDPINNSPFTQTFLYASQHGKIIAYEPMISLAFLKSTSGFERNIPQPKRFTKTGFYPTKMTISKYNRQVDVILEDFVFRIQS